MEFKDHDMASFWEDPASNPPRRVPPELRRVLYRKLQMLDAAHDLRDLRIPPSNHLERLRYGSGNLHSIRVNDQWRLRFDWTKQGAREVEFCDYH